MRAIGLGGLFLLFAPGRNAAWDVGAWPRRRRAAHLGSEAERGRAPTARASEIGSSANRQIRRLVLSV
jgi:hypothetical protein